MRHWWPKTAAAVAILLILGGIGYEASAQKRNSFGSAGSPRNSGGSRTEESSKPAAASNATTPSGPSFKTYEILTQRNIFDPTRVPIKPQHFTSTPKPHADTLSIVGVFMSDERHFAIFDSSVPGVGGTYASGDEVGGLKILSLDTEHVVLQDGKRTLDLPMGSGLSRKPNEDWRLVSGGGTVTVASEDETPGDSDDGTTGTVSAIAPPPVPAGMSDLAKKMMERRLKESGQKETKQ